MKVTLPTIENYSAQKCISHIDTYIYFDTVNKVNDMLNSKYNLLIINTINFVVSIGQLEWIGMSLKSVYCLYAV